MTKQLGRPPVLNEVALIAPIPNQKADFNNRGAFSTDYIGGSWDYPDGSYERRAEIWQEHVDYIAGFFWFLAHDPRAPKLRKRRAAAQRAANVFREHPYIGALAARDVDRDAV